MKDAILIELAAVWELQAETGGDGLNSLQPAARETLRACADALRMLVDSQPTPPSPPVAQDAQQGQVDRAPEPLRRLGEWLSRVLNEDQWATAERMLLGACEAARSLPTSGEPVAEFRGRRMTPEGTREFWGVMLCGPDADPPAGTKLVPITAPHGWALVLPGRLHTDRWDSARVGDYNNGWNDCLRKTKAELEKLSTAPQQARQPSKDQIREVFLANGFTIKDGQTDLKPYVFDAAYALLGITAAPGAGGEGV